MTTPPSPPDDRQRRFVALLSRDSAALRAYLLFVLRDRVLTDDAMQEVAIVLWERFDDYDQARPFLPWARGVARFTALRLGERRRRDLPLLSPEALDACEAAFIQHAPANEETEALDRCLEHLPDPARRLLHLRYQQDLPLDVVAERTRSSVTAVTKALSRLRTQLGDCIRKRLAVGQP